MSRALRRRYGRTSGSELPWGVFDVTRGKWMPNPLVAPVDMRPARYASKAYAGRVADEWKRYNPDAKFEARHHEAA